MTPAVQSTSRQRSATSSPWRSPQVPFDPQAANLMFMLVSRRYERASLIVTSNKPFSAWGEIFDDEVTAAAMIDRLVHHAEILALKGDSYRLKDRDLARAPPTD
nr:ATP-binding protein [Conexibacter sp. W3-3-2]